MTKTLSILAATLAILLGAAGSVGAQGASSDAEALESTRDKLSKWVETQQMISKEKKDWALAKDMLEQQIALREHEIEVLEEKIAETRKTISDADRKRQELVNENEALRTASASLYDSITTLENKTLELLASLPAPARERVAPLSRRIPTGAAKSERSLSERFQNVIGILNELNKFNTDVTVKSEIRELADGSMVEVQSLYLGLGQAYYVSPNGKVAGVGRPSPEAPDGWDWQSANELAPEIARAIAILQNEEVPAFVPLPVEIR